MNEETLKLCKQIYNNLDEELKTNFFGTMFLMATKEENIEVDTTVFWMNEPIETTFFIDECETKSTITPWKNYQIQCVITTYNFNIYSWNDKDRFTMPDNYISESSVKLIDFLSQDNEENFSNKKLTNILTNHFGNNIIDNI